MLNKTFSSGRPLVILTLFVLCTSYKAFSQMELNNGDMAVVGLNANNYACSGTATEDMVSVVFFKDITPGTTIDMTDNGWERTTAGLWGNSEGTIRATRTGTTIPAGTIVTFRFISTYSALVPDANWTFTSLNGMTTLNMNSGGDQLYFMQGGTWTNPNSGLNNSSYTGSVLFGFNTRTTWAADGTTQQSNLYMDLGCFSMAPTGGATDFIKYTGDTTGTDQKSWVIRINNPSNWSSYASCALYNSSGYDYLSGIKFRITSFFNVDAGHDSTVCASSSPFSLGGVPTGGTWSGTGVSGTQFDPAVSGAGTFMVTYTYNDAGCLYNDAKNITVTALATTAAAGNDQSVCGTTATLAGNTPTVGTGTWTLISGVGTITSTSSATSGITGLGVGVNVFQWTITNSCASSSDQVTITGVASPTTANAGTDQTVCGNIATLSGNTAVTGTGTWTLINGSGTITNSSSATSGITNLGVGANVFQWTIANNPCPSSSDQVTITGVASPTTADAGTDQILCGNTTTLAGNTPTDGTGTWTVVSGSGTITNPSSATSGITGLGVGANVFQWTIANAPCPASSDQVTITGVTSPTTANAGSDQIMCGNTATLAGNAPTDGTGIWTLVSGTGTITNPSSPTSGITGMSVGVNTFQWTITNAPCPSSSDQVSITITSTPTIAAAGTDQSVCGTTTNLTGNTPTDGTGIWTLVSGSGNITNPSSATSGITGLGVGANVFQWTISSPPCTPSSDQVTITGVASPTTADAGTDQVLCGNTTTLAGNTPTDGIGTWTVVSGSGTITNPSSPTSGITGLGTGVNVFQWTIANAPCPASSDTVAITSETAIGQIDNQTNVKCFGDSTGSVTVSMTGGTAPITYIWSQDATNNTNSASDLPAGSYSVAISDLYGACLDTINILITQPTKLTDSILSQDVMCYGLSDGILSVNVSGGTNPYTYVWNTIPAQYTATVTGLSQGTYTVTITDHNNCNTTVSGSVNEPATLSVLDSIINPICFGGNSGSVYLTVTGGTSPYNYHWTNNESSQDLLNIGEGSYIVTVTDAHNCTMTSISHLFNPPAIIITDTMTISATNTGNIDITVSGGTVPYTYLWSNGATTQDISNLGNAIYIVTVTDMNTCAVTDTISVNIPELPVIIPTLFSPNGDGKNDTWEIKGIQQFTDAHIMIYNRWGNLVFEYNGTAIGYLDTGKRWDGKYNGKDLPMGSYVYIVIFDGTKTYNGVVSIAR